MIQIEENGNIIYMIAEGKLNDDDYDKMLPLLRSKIKEHGTIRWYFQMKDFKGWTMHAFWRDVHFDLKNKEQLEKVAIVGESKWQEVMTDFMKPFTDADIRYFDEEKAGEAQSWIEAGTA